MGNIKSSEDFLKDRFWNGEYYNINPTDFSEILDMMQEYAEQFIDLVAK